jgi:hypothetical protein
LKKAGLNGVGGGNGFVTGKLIGLYTAKVVGGYALLSKISPLLDSGDFATLHR